ncbi:hypothetical protein E4U40_002705 [Claviceps sp. LM458 group G5]|nr:hypothetical protein E4U40_002705 [Claviceps sp. LM458 group G5]
MASTARVVGDIETGYVFAFCSFNRMRDRSASWCLLASLLKVALGLGSRCLESIIAPFTAFAVSSGFRPVIASLIIDGGAFDRQLRVKGIAPTMTGTAGAELNGSQRRPLP